MNNEDQQITVFPVAGITTQLVARLHAVMLRIDVVQPMGDGQQRVVEGPNFLLTEPQLVALAEQVERGLKAVRDLTEAKENGPAH